MSEQVRPRGIATGDAARAVGALTAEEFLRVREFIGDGLGIDSADRFVYVGLAEPDKRLVLM